jgi:hypothetical protein
VLSDEAYGDALSIVDSLRKLGYQRKYPRTSGLTGVASDEPAMFAGGGAFGQAISMTRKGLGLSQQELAVRVMREESSWSISTQYLNDI